MFVPLLMILFAILILALIITVILPLRLQRTYDLPTASLPFVQKSVSALHLVRNQESLSPPDPSQTQTLPFEIATGESVDQICDRLKQAEMILSKDTFTTFLVYFGFDRNLQTGIFSLSPSMSAKQVAQILTDPYARQIPFTILPGWRLEEIAASLPTSGLQITPDQFLSITQNPPYKFSILLGISTPSTLEGFLFPGTYYLSREISPEELIHHFLLRFLKVITPEFQEAISTQGLSLQQAVTMASIIERETKIDSEKPMIASVFLNRLKANMMLETDPTVQYALGYQADAQTWWKSPLFFADLEVNSPYNTYQYFGLPSAPISNPSLTSIQAVASPQDTPYYYFRAACDGSGAHNFAVTYEEHLANQCP